MRGPHNIWRLIRVGATMERNGAMATVLDAFDAPPALRMVARGVAWPLRRLGYEGDPSLPPVSRSLLAMGPAYIKFGQVLSTRPDVVGGDLAAQLRVLQDSLPPFSRDLAIEQISAELGQPASEIFNDISEPVAAASIAQVHKAVLRKTGEAVAVKVLRPGIEQRFKQDIDTFYFAAHMVDIFAPFARRLRPLDVVHHFEGVVLGELDLRLESANASELYENTKDDEGFRVPKVKWGASGRRILTLEWIEGVGAGDIAAMDEMGVDRHALAVRVLQMFLRHALRDGFFHADMHQGNLKIDSQGDLIALDFGIMGRIDEYTRRTYAQIIYGFTQRDYHRVAQVHFEAGYVPREQDVAAFALALRAVGEPIFGMDASRISMGRLFGHLFEVTETFGMQTRTELILLQRTMVVVEGVSRTLAPETMNIWEAAEPEVREYVRSSIGPKAFGRDLVEILRVLGRYGPRLPQIVERGLSAQSQNVTIVEAPKRWDRFIMGAIVGGCLVALAILV